MSHWLSVCILDFQKVPLHWEKDMLMRSEFLDRKVNPAPTCILLIFESLCLCILNSLLSFRPPAKGQYKDQPCLVPEAAPGDPFACVRLPAVLVAEETRRRLPVRPKVLPSVRVLPFDRIAPQRTAAQKGNPGKQLLISAQRCFFTTTF